MKEKWTQQLQQKLADYEQAAPELSWADIERAVAKSKNHRQRAFIIPLWVRRAAVAAVVVMMAGGIGWHLLQQETTSHVPTAQVTSNQKPSPTPSHQADKPTENTLVANRQSSQKMSPATFIERLLPSDHEHDEGTREATPLLADSKDTPETDKDDKETAQKPSANTGRPRQSTHQESLHKRTDVYPDYGLPSRTSDGHTLVAKVYASGGLGSNSMSSSPVMLASAMPYGMSSMDMSTTTQYVNNAAGQEPSVKTKHHQPVRVGVSVRYPLNDRWSVEAGLAYTWLSADITRSNGTTTSQTTQRLQYLGIPVGVNYRLWSSRHFSVYASAGGMGEKMVRGRAKTSTYIADENIGETSEKVKVNPLQWSVKAAVGAEYNIQRNISVYVEPGVAYHFDNHSKVKTIYQDKPTNFDLNVGIRFNVK